MQYILEIKDCNLLKMKKIYKLCVDLKVSLLNHFRKFVIAHSCASRLIP
jgi:hypothetical protein